MPNDDVLTESEIWCRICRPAELRKLVADRTAALTQAGREEELRQWLDQRAAIDKVWEERQAKFNAEVFGEFVKELMDRPLAFAHTDEQKIQPNTSESPAGELNEAAQRIAEAWKDPQVFDEVMAENKWLNATEAAERLADPLPLQELKVSAAMNHLLEEFRTIIRVEGLDAHEVAASFTAMLREEVELSAHDASSLDPQSQYPHGITDEQKARWQQQENDPRQVAAAEAAREERDHVEMPTRHSLPSMSKEAKEDFVREVAKSTESLSNEIAPQQDSPKIKL